MEHNMDKSNTSEEGKDSLETSSHSKIPSTKCGNHGKMDDPDDRELANPGPTKISQMIILMIKPGPRWQKKALAHL
jgi:hypothetical protein